MDSDYDTIVCGTGFTECILSGLLSTEGKEKVLHIDRNSYYGGESASLNLTNLFERFGAGTPPKEWGANRNWNVDLIPKFIMTNGNLVKILMKTKVKNYLSFKVVEGSYVYQHQKAGWVSGEKFIHKVPATDTEALSSSLIPLQEKLRGKAFFAFIARWDPAVPSTWGGLNPTVDTMRKAYEHFGVTNANVCDFVGHAIALETDDSYLDRPFGETMDKLKLYLNSLLRYGNSPFIYPMYGLGTLPEGFSRLSAVHGGTYMLQTPIKRFLFDENSKVIGVEGPNGEVCRAKRVVCDPSYVIEQMEHNPEQLKGLVTQVGSCVRSICVLTGPIPGTGGRTSCQIVLPQKQLGRKSDIYIAMVSATHGICSEGRYVAMVSATVETNNPEKEIQPALGLLGPIEKTFTSVSPLYRATTDGKQNNLIITDSYDATSHFESATDNVLSLWKSITGSDLDLELPPDGDEEEE